jgi:hypothetical protein
MGRLFLPAGLTAVFQRFAQILGGKHRIDVTEAVLLLEGSSRVALPRVAGRQRLLITTAKFPVLSDTSSSLIPR